MVTLTVRCSELDKTYFDTMLNDVADQHSNIVNKRVDALKIIFKAFEGKTELGYDELIPEIKSIIDEVKCPFLKYDSVEGFQCYEKFYKTKESKPLGEDELKIINRCALCKQGKKDLEQRNIEKMFQKDSVRKLVDFRKAFMNIMDFGFSVEAYLCTGRMLYDNTVALSVDGKHFNCPLQEDEPVLIEKVCKETISPITGQPPCKYFVNLFHHVDLIDIDKVSEILPSIHELPFEDIDEEPKKIEVETQIINDKEKGGEKEE